MQKNIQKRIALQKRKEVLQFFFETLDCMSFKHIELNITLPSSLFYDTIKLIKNLSDNLDHNIDSGLIAVDPLIYDCINVEHLLLEILKNEKSWATNLLTELNINLAELQNAIIDSTKGDRIINWINQKTLPFSRDVVKIISYALLISNELNKKYNIHDCINTRDLMLAIIKNKKSKAAQILNRFGLNYRIYKNKIIDSSQHPIGGKNYRKFKKSVLNEINRIDKRLNNLNNTQTNRIWKKKDLITPEEN